MRRFPLLFLLILIAALPAEDDGSQVMPRDLKEVRGDIRDLGKLDEQDRNRLLRCALDGLGREPAKIADHGWYAWQLAEIDALEAGELVAERLHQVLASESTEDDLVAPLLAHAVVQLTRGPADPADVRKLWAIPAQSNLALVLMGRDPKTYAEELRMLVAEPDGQLRWFAAAGLLVEERDAEVAALLLAKVELSLGIRVIDSVEGAFGNRRGGGRRRDLGWFFTDRWLPTVTYHLAERRAGEGFTALTGGSHPIAWFTSTRYGEVDEPPVPRQDLRNLNGPSLELVTRDLLPYPRLQVPWRCHTVHWNGGPAYLAEVTAQRRSLLDDWRGLLVELEQEELLTQEQAVALKPALKIAITDDRQDKTTALPPLPAEWEPRL